MYRKSRGVSIAAAVVVLVVACALAATEQRAQVSAEQAVITFIDGDVQVRHGTSGWTKAQLNELLQPTDAIKTGEDSRAEISLGEGRIVRLNENTHLLITHLKSDGLTRLKVLLGGVWVTIEKALTGKSKFEVQMPSAVASVKGTVFRCDVPGSEEEATYVYEGEVELKADSEVIRVPALQYLVFRRGRRGKPQPIDFGQDDVRPWVRYNRHRDVLRHLGNPQIIVALREDENIAAPAGFVASKALARTLRRLGLPGASVSKQDLPKFSFASDGLVRWHQRPRAQYQIVGLVHLEDVERRDGQVSVRVRGIARLLPVGQGPVFLTVTSVASAVGPDARQAATTALDKLGMRLGAEMAPRAIKAMLARTSKGPVRVVPMGQYNRKQIAVLHHLLARTRGVFRVTPVSMPGTRMVLVVVGQNRPEQIAAALRSARDVVQSASVRQGVVYVMLRPFGTQIRRLPAARPGGMHRPPGPRPPMRPPKGMRGDRPFRGTWHRR